MTPSACPRCGKSPVEITTMSEATPSHVPSCPCHPLPPLCIGCQAAIKNDRCENLACRYCGLIQPAPLTDPLYGEEYAL